MTKMNQLKIIISTQNFTEHERFDQVKLPNSQNLLGIFVTKDIFVTKLLEKL